VLPGRQADAAAAVAALVDGERHTDAAFVAWATGWIVAAESPGEFTRFMSAVTSSDVHDVDGLLWGVQLRRRDGLGNRLDAPVGDGNIVYKARVADGIEDTAQSGVRYLWL
jgi:hypothetical protein